MNNQRDIFQYFISDVPNLYEVFHRDSSLVGPFVKKGKPVKTPFYPFKAYPRFQLIQLPPPVNLQMTLHDVMFKRSSARTYNKQKLTLAQIGTLLYYSIGLKDRSRPYTSMRFVPSAGALYSLEAYVMSMNSYLAQGFYHYNSKVHGLEEMQQCSSNTMLSCFSDEFVQKASLVIIIASRFERPIKKYQQRGYRYLQIEAGHIGQQFSLISTAIKVGSCPIGCFDDLKINKLLHIFPRHEACLYAYAFGHN